MPSCPSLLSPARSTSGEYAVRRRRHQHAAEEEITAAALEAISLAHVPLPETCATACTPTPTSLSTPVDDVFVHCALLAQCLEPASAILPVASTREGRRLQEAARILAMHLHAALAPPRTDTLVEHALRALQPVALCSASLRRCLSQLHVVPLLLCAVTPQRPRHASLALLVLRPLLRGSAFARARFAECDGPRRLLDLLHAAAAVAAAAYAAAAVTTSDNDHDFGVDDDDDHDDLSYEGMCYNDEDGYRHAYANDDYSALASLLIPTCAVLADVVPQLPSGSTHPLRTTPALQLLRRLIERAAAPNFASSAASSIATATDATTGTSTTTPSHHVQVATAAFRLLRALLTADPTMTQPLVRRNQLLHSAISVMHAVPQVAPSALHFLHAAVVNDMENVAMVGSIQSALALDFALRACRFPGVCAESLSLLADLLRVLSLDAHNFRRLHLLGLTSALMGLLPRLETHAQAGAIALLARSLSAPGTGTAMQVGPAADAVLRCLTGGSGCAPVQAAGLSALATILTTCPTPIPPSLPSRAVQAAHFAMTEHADKPRVLEACAHLFLAVPPAEIVASVCPLADLIKLLRARLRVHCLDDDAADALADAVHALKFVDDAVQTSRHAAVTLPVSSSSPSLRVRSASLRAAASASGSFRLSLGRRTRLVPPKPDRHSGDPTTPPRSRRTRSDFAMDYHIDDAAAVAAAAEAAALSRSCKIAWKKRSHHLERSSGDLFRSKLSRRSLTSASFPSLDRTDALHLAQSAATFMAEPLSRALARSKQKGSAQFPSPHARDPAYAHGTQALSHQFHEDRSSSVAWVEASLRKPPPPLCSTNNDPVATTTKNNNNNNNHDGNVNDNVNSETSKSFAELHVPSELRNVTATNCSGRGVHFSQSDHSFRPGDTTGSMYARGTFKNVSPVRPSSPMMVAETERRERPPVYVPEIPKDDEGDSAWDGDDGSDMSKSGSESSGFNGAWASNDGLTSLAYNLGDDELYDKECDDDTPHENEKPLVYEDMKLEQDNKMDKSDQTKFTPSLSWRDNNISEKNPSPKRMFKSLRDDYSSHSSPSTTLSSRQSQEEPDMPLSPSMDCVDADLLAATRKFGERERKRVVDISASANHWSRPSWSIWPMSAASDFSNESRSYPSFYPRVESGSLQGRR